MRNVAFVVSVLVSVSCSSHPKEDMATATPGASLTASSSQKVAAAKDCSDDSFCTREYLPTICQFSGQSFEGSNPCEAKKLVRRYACEKDLKFVDADVSCKSKEEPVIESAPAAAPAKKGKGK